MEELEEAMHEYCHLPVKGGAENVHGKVNILLQIYISRGRVRSFSLVSDMTYITQNAARIVRALFEIVLRKNLPLLAGRMLRFAKCIERQMWDFDHPLKQHPLLKPDIAAKFDNFNVTLDKLRELTGKEIGQLIRNVHAGVAVRRAAEEIPLLDIDVTIQPITRTVLRVRLSIRPNFRWNDRVHGKTSEPFWIWVEDPTNDHMYHHEYFLLTRKQVMAARDDDAAQELVFTIPIFDPLPSQYYVRAVSDRWIGSESTAAISFQHLILPERHPPHTDLLDLQPLPVSALGDPFFEQLYSFSHFNPIQTQARGLLYTYCVQSN
jgi:activating signal cointegrator complex subunit 3